MSLRTGARHFVVFLICDFGQQQRNNLHQEHFWIFFSLEREEQYLDICAYTTASFGDLAWTVTHLSVKSTWMNLSHQLLCPTHRQLSIKRSVFWISNSVIKSEKALSKEVSQCVLCWPKQKRQKLWKEDAGQKNASVEIKITKQKKII